VITGVRHTGIADKEPFPQELDGRQGELRNHSGDAPWLSDVAFDKCWFGGLSAGISTGEHVIEKPVNYLLGFVIVQV